MPLYEIDVVTEFRHTMVVEAANGTEAKRKARAADYVECWETSTGPIRASGHPRVVSGAPVDA